MAGVIYEKQDNYWLYHKLTVEDDEEEKLQPADKAWTIVKYSQNKAGSAGGLKLRIGDTVKFGRVRFLEDFLSLCAGFCGVAVNGGFEFPLSELNVLRRLDIVGFRFFVHIQC
jgi:hypothetical protein